MCFCLGNWGALDSTKSGHTDKIRCSVKSLPFSVGYWRVLEYNLEDKTQSTLAKLGILVDILEMFCRIFEQPAKCTSSEFIYCTGTLEFDSERTRFYLWEITYEKKQSPVKMSFSWETGQPMSTTWRCGKHGDMAFFLIIDRGGFLFTYFIRISWNQIKCNKVCIKLCFMK